MIENQPLFLVDKDPITPSVSHKSRQPQSEPQLMPFSKASTDTRPLAKSVPGARSNTHVNAESAYAQPTYVQPSFAQPPQMQPMGTFNPQHTHMQGAHFQQRSTVSPKRPPSPTIANGNVALKKAKVPLKACDVCHQQAHSRTTKVSITYSLLHD
jgi:hypothetical protein